MTKDEEQVKPDGHAGADDLKMDARVEALESRLWPLIMNRQLSPEDMPDLLEVAARRAEADPAIRAYLASADETVQIKVDGTAPGRWMWLRIDRGKVSTGRGPISPTVTVEFVDEKSLVKVATDVVALAARYQASSLSGVDLLTPLGLELLVLNRQSIRVSGDFSCLFASFRGGG